MADKFEPFRTVFEKLGKFFDNLGKRINAAFQKIVKADDIEDLEDVFEIKAKDMIKAQEAFNLFLKALKEGGDAAKSFLEVVLAAKKKDIPKTLEAVSEAIVETSEAAEAVKDVIEEIVDEDEEEE
jgi:hypothetical protein